MKTFIVLLFFFSTSVICQELNKIITDERTGKPMLIGYCNREAFADSNFAWWFNAEYNMYEVDTATLSEVNNIDSVDIFIVMGTWCSDSKREVPRLYKILDYLNYPEEKLLVISVNRDMVALGDEVTSLEIEFVPTFIFFTSGGNEIGRIIEAPIESLEKDLAEVLTKK